MAKREAKISFKGRSRNPKVDNKNPPAISPNLLARLKKKKIALFQQLTEDEQRTIWEWSREVIRQYRITLESNPSNVRNVRELPFSKDDIKLAIKIALPLYVSKDLQRMIKVLKTAYRELGAFQVIDPSETEKAISTNSSSKRSSSAGKKRSIFKSDAYIESIISEKKALLDEINIFVNDLEALA